MVRALYRCLVFIASGDVSATVRGRDVLDFRSGCRNVGRCATDCGRAQSAVAHPLTNMEMGDGGYCRTRATHHRLREFLAMGQALLPLNVYSAL
jgi:hypothetical protein